MKEHEDYIEERTSLGNAPAYGGDEEERDEVRDRCREDRESMRPHETADCAGSALEEQYENEEDGGS